MNFPSPYEVLFDKKTDYLLMLDQSQITACQVERRISGTTLNVILRNGLTLELPPAPAKLLIESLRGAGILTEQESALFNKQIETPPPGQN
jgi:hypothetical protein